MKTLFDFKDCKLYLQNLCDSERGTLTRLAEAAGCQKSYLSTCLKGKTNLTMDHAFGMSLHLGHSEEEREYFFLLIEKEKASTSNLRHHLEEKIKNRSREAYRLKNQQANTHILNEGETKQMAFYYSTWMSTAIHMFTSIYEFQTVASIAKRIGIAQDQVQAQLSQLSEYGLVKKEGHSYKWNSGNIYLPDKTQWILNHHQNWRMRSLDNIQRKDDEALHYSSIQSMSKADFEVLKKKIATYIRGFNEISDPSDPEEVYCFSIDFFKC